MNLGGFLGWARDSETWLTSASRARSPGKGVLALPPVQRTAVWGPKQIVDLWDSVLRGLPIGSFYLVHRGEGRKARAMGTDAGNRDDLGEGWDLLDGQQRTRALLLGLRGPSLERGARDARCLWIDLGEKSRPGNLGLRLTSASQPFGYNAESGQKLPIDDRRKARIEIEPRPDEDPIKRDGVSRPAYTHELFEGFLRGDLAPKSIPAGWKKGWPPLPYKAARGAGMFPFHVLLAAWKGGSDESERLGELREVVCDAEVSEQAIDELHKAFLRLERAQIALVKVEVGGDDDLLLLFDRIGAAGSPLTVEERLFSVYKRHVPAIHDVVNAIYERVGRVLPPTKIAAAAIRIANARSHELPNQGNALPSPAAFAREMSGAPDPQAKRLRTIREALDELLPADTGGGSLEEGAYRGSPGEFGLAFQQLFFDLLAYRTGNDIGLPKVMITMLSPDLVGVLLLWLIRARAIDAKAIPDGRDDIVRFVLFWGLSVRDEDKASRLCFQKIRESQEVVPFELLYDLLTRSQEMVALPLASPDEITRILCSEQPASWRDHAQRLPANAGDPIELARRWWDSYARSLPWLQRAYLERSFPDFDPTSGRDDETPYDIDHMIPRKDFARDWRTFLGAVERSEDPPSLTEEERTRIRYARTQLGESIGNLRLVDFSTNRSDSDAPFAVKGLKDSEGTPPAEREAYYADMAFDPQQEGIWKLASGDETRAWPARRLAAFQEAVEKRCAWLYRRFYVELSFQRWQGPGLEISPLAPSNESEVP